MSSNEEMTAMFNSLRQSDKAVVANYFDMCAKYPGLIKAFDAWNRKNGGYTVGEFFDFRNSYEASGTPCGFSGQSILN